MQQLAATPISLHCWQGDDVGGFENPGGELGSGLAVTGNYPGKARTLDELRQDLEAAYTLLPGKHRLNLHAIYGTKKGVIPGQKKGSFQDKKRGHSVGFDINSS